ncbi:MAG: Unknown protein [uncultured Sulfurovum sp.]|uniref:Uncharacterized protein n=1 Tax=uncultured Sulfurovum sp. TaxID=269237 RepID=A0A6S6TFS4_9BACT|nr:MAG: Unknown protein [uncultured Sulfurovum sp.]
MPEQHDPYLNTIQRGLNEDKIKTRKKKVENTEPKSKSFFTKNIILSDYIHLPESLQKFFLLTTFILIPYILGVFIMSVVMGYKTLKDFTTFNFDLYMLSWTIGYETMALILLIIIIKSAIVFKK